MSSRTKIIVLHMKEIIYTAVFAVLGIVLILLLLFMFLPEREKHTDKEAKYTPGSYTSTVTLGSNALEVEVSVDESRIHSIRFSNLNESVSAMYPLIQPTLEELAEQIYAKQSLENLEYSSDSPYTAQIITDAIREALKKAETTK